ncbi:alpha-N-acetylgalactosamine-specific lectin-like [Patiria miniata]|uniref:C-type lectin domain-containing protein n=1 Tax=Patiria miniata TaxID=46514 RepID=A0A914AS46_PATMI|nr:alpha-N-acetylgalactosamine-specific lectin-like [Patiria miniata]
MAMRHALILLVLVSIARADLECGPLWSRFGDHCYRFFGPPKTWQNAEDHCRKFFTRFGQGHLASIHGEAENNVLLELWESSLPSLDGVGSHAWLGANDIDHESRFEWTDGSPFNYGAWRDGEPSNSGNAEHCLNFFNWQGAIGWNDANCSQYEFPYICKVSTAEEKDNQ